MAQPSTDDAVTEPTGWESSPVIKNVVVQDGGKLLVVGTLYGGLTMSLNEGDSPFSTFAKVALVELSSMLFVDIMRLFCVAGSDAARDANGDRYTEFIGIADQHLKELSAQITRLVSLRDGAVSIAAAQVEKKLVWALERLRSKPRLDRPWAEMANSLAQFTLEISSFCDKAAPEYFHRCQVVARETLLASQIKNQHALLPDKFVRVRHGIQSRLLVRLKADAGLDFGTIKDDVERVLSVPYFTIDTALLSSIVQMPMH